MSPPEKPEGASTITSCSAAKEHLGNAAGQWSKTHQQVLFKKKFLSGLDLNQIKKNSKFFWQLRDPVFTCNDAENEKGPKT